MILTVEEDVSRAIVECSQNTWHDEGVILPKAARTVRRFPFTEEETFEGKLSKRQKASLPFPLLNLVSLILDGETTIENASTNAETVTTNLAQLLRFNAVKTKRICDGFLRHSKFNEPTLPVKIGLLVHAKTRKKSLVETLVAKGLSISYQRVQDIQKMVKNQLCDKFKKDGAVCPPSLQKELFLNAVTDNIDHNPSLIGAKSSFHRTSISFFQHPNSDVTGLNQFKLEKDSDNLPNLTLPKSYTDIKPLIGGQPKYPVSNLPQQTSRITTHIEAQARK